MAITATTLPVSYTTVGDVLTAIPNIGSSSNVTSGVVANLAGKVEARMNAKLSRKYSLPISGTVPILTAIATDLTCYELLAKFNFVQGKVGESSWPDRFLEADKLLTGIVDGEIPLLTSSLEAVTVTAGAAANPWSNNDGYLPTMREDSWVDHVVDQNKLDDLEDDREF